VDQIYPASGQICPIKLDLLLWKSRLEAKMMNLGPYKLTTSKQDTIEHIEIKGTTRATQTLGITPTIRSNLEQERT
jgi:hypothetical protein